jgi:hypothetical protein
VSACASLSLPAQSGRNACIAEAETNNARAFTSNMYLEV